MLRSQCFRVVLTLLGIVAMSRAGLAQVQLNVKVPAGKKIAISTDITVNQVLTLAGMNIESKSEQNSVGSATYSKIGPDGKYRVEHKTETLQLRIKAAGMEFAFDSVNPDKEADNPLGKQIAETLKATLKANWTSVHDKSNHIVAVEGIEKALEGLSPEAAAGVRSELDPEYLKDSLNLKLDRIPTKPVKKGDTWEQMEPARVGSGQTLTFKQRYTYTGTVEKNGVQLDRIEVTTTDVTFDIAADSPIPLKLVKSDLKIANSKGELLFDRQQGSSVEETSKIQIKGSLTFSINGQELPGELDLTFDSAGRVRP